MNADSKEFHLYTEGNREEFKGVKEGRSDVRLAWK